MFIVINCPLVMNLQTTIIIILYLFDLIYFWMCIWFLIWSIFKMQFLTVFIFPILPLISNSFWSHERNLGNLICLLSFPDIFWLSIWCAGLVSLGKILQDPPCCLECMKGRLWGTSKPVVTRLKSWWILLLENIQVTIVLILLRQIFHVFLWDPLSIQYS